MPENKKDKSPTDVSNVERRVKSLEKSVEDLKKITIANLYGKYDEDIEAEVSDNLKYGTVLAKENFLKRNFHLTFLLFALAILVLNFLTFAVVTGKGLAMLEKVGIKLEPVSVAGAVVEQPNPNEPKFVDASIDDDAVLGNPNAPVTMIEFSDYDCPYCRTFHMTQFSSLKKDYIDTGKVKFIYRDLPLAQLHPLAREKALAANCAREQGGDEAYYLFHDQIFTRSETQQKTLVRDDLNRIATDLSLDVGQFSQCLDSEKYGEEVDKDLADAIAIESFGTPTFIIGKSSPNGTVEEGRLIEGLPQSYLQFKQIIDEYLN